MRTGVGPHDGMPVGRLKTAVLAAALSLLAGCGAKSIAVGSFPFPADKPVFIDETGKEMSSLPPSSEPIRLVMIDSPWCPLCREAWGALASASSTFPPGSVRVYRILFDRERLYTREGVRESSPLSPAPAPGMAAGRSGAAPSGVTTLTAIPGPFRDQFRVGQVPILLLLSEDGMVETRWVGYSPSLDSQLAEEVSRRTGSPLPPER